MKSGTFNFWIERETDPETFARGTRCRWASFAVDGETCVISSDGPTLIATLRVASAAPITLFKIPFAPSLTRRHLVTVGWKAGRMKVILDSKLVAEVAVDFPQTAPATAAASGAEAGPSVLRQLSLLLLAALYPSLAHAHLGKASTQGWLLGLAHPIGGLDHILAMVAVGLWAAQRGGRAVWTIPLTFVGVMTFGGWLGMTGYSVPFFEQGIVASVLVLGLLIAAAVRLPVAVSAGIVAVFAICHGYAHGIETPHNAAGFAYSVGFILATMALHATGVVLAMLIHRRNDEVHAVRWAGGAIALCGLYLSVF